MGTEAYNPDKIPHIKGQDRRIDSPDKARIMASRADSFENIASGFKEYETQDAAERETWDKDAKSFFDDLEKRGVSPEYIRAVGDLVAESAGSIYDYREEVAEKSVEELQKDSASARQELLSYKKHPYISTENLPVSAQSPQGAMKVEFPAASRGEQVTSMEDVAEYHRVARVLNKFQAANEEIGRRLKFKE